MVVSEQPESEPSVQAGSPNTTLDQGGWLTVHEPLHFAGSPSTALLPGPTSRVVPVQGGIAGCVKEGGCKHQEVAPGSNGMPKPAQSCKLQGCTQG